MKEGIRLDYETEETLIDVNFYFSNVSMIPEALRDNPYVTAMGGDGSAYIVIEREKPIHIRLSVILLEIRGNRGLFNVTLEIDSYSSSRELLVDLQERDVFLLDGTPLGKTTIWIPPCKGGDEIRFVGSGDSTVFANISGPFIFLELESLSLTEFFNYLQDPKKFQDSLILDVPTASKYQGIHFDEKISPVERQSIKHFETRQNVYDADTFILVRGNNMDGDAFLSAFDILVISQGLRLTYTNIDLGPPNWLALIGFLLIPAIIIILIIGIPLYMLRKRKRKRWE
ncbi:MAG: hypothetical protein QW304_01755 [Thermoproteota archaeon]